jgi:molybdopterin converting factor subunit 1
MRIKVRLFARAKELAGTDFLVIEMKSAASIAELSRYLEKQTPALSPLLKQSAWAVNQEFAGLTTSLYDGAEVAILPPVSGG